MNVLARCGPVERVSRVIGAIPVDHVGVFELDRLAEVGVVDTSFDLGVGFVGYSHGQNVVDARLVLVCACFVV